MRTGLVDIAEGGAASEKARPRNRMARIVRTARTSGERLAERPDVPFQQGTPATSDLLLNVRRDRPRQEVLGFGGAFTEAAAHTLAQLSPALREEIIDAYFHAERGIGYTFCRTHINSCDFALGNYAYAETEGDHDLENFSIDRDRKWLIPMIHAASERLAPGALRLLASPWSPPAWMKTNGEMNHGGKLRPECRRAWALYFARYIKAYAAEGIPIWGVTVQNEPQAVQRWDSCIYSHEEQRDFVRDHLGPRLAEQALEDVRILVWDHNKDEIVPCADAILSDPRAARFVWGIGFHWYSGDDFDQLAEVRRKYPNKQLVFTEGCQEGGVKLGSWDLGERYGHAVMGDLNHGTTGWIDWNMVLDQNGGPNHVGNFCDAPIIADTDTDTVHYQSSYYYLGHFSRYFLPGSVILETEFGAKSGLEAVACRRPDGSVAVVVMNTDSAECHLQVKDDESFAAVQMPGHSIATLLFP